MVQSKSSYHHRRVEAHLSAILHDLYILGVNIANKVAITHNVTLNKENTTDLEALETPSFPAHLLDSQCLVSLESQSGHPAPYRVSSDLLTETCIDAHPSDSPELPTCITKVKVKSDHLR